MQKSLAGEAGLNFLTISVQWSAQGKKLMSQVQTKNQENVSDSLTVFEPPARGEAAQSALAGVRGRSPREHFALFHHYDVETLPEKHTLGRILLGRPVPR